MTKITLNHTKNHINPLEKRSSNFSVKGPMVKMGSFADHTVSVPAIYLCCNILYMCYINIHEVFRTEPRHSNCLLLSSTSRHIQIKGWNFKDKEGKKKSFRHLGRKTYPQWGKSGWPHAFSRQYLSPEANRTMSVTYQGAAHVTKNSAPSQAVQV